MVIFHDNTLDRMCGISSTIEEYSYADLPELLIPPHLSDVPHVRNDRESTKIPLLIDLLNEFPTYPMQIDVKNGSEELVLKVGRYIEKFGRQSSTVWGSFVPKVCDLCYAHFGTSIPLFFSRDRAFMGVFLYSINCLSLMNIRESALIAPAYNKWFTKGFIKALNQLGVSVLLFGVGSGALNDEESWIEAKAMGANGICSDCPTSLQKWLLRHPLNARY